LDCCGFLFSRAEIVGDKGYIVDSSILELVGRRWLLLLVLYAISKLLLAAPQGL